METALTKIDDDKPKVDKRTKNGSKIDILKLVKLRDVHGHSFSEIGRIMGYDPGYCHRVYTDLKQLLPSDGITEAYKDNRVALLNGVEYLLLKDIADKDKRKKASLNNTAYAMGQVSNLRRLESNQPGQILGIGVEVRLTKALERAGNNDRDKV